MRTAQLLALTALFIAQAAIPGCHYHINAMPHIVISSEPFTAEHSVNNMRTQPTEAGDDSSTP